MADQAFPEAKIFPDKKNITIVDFLHDRFKNCPNQVIYRWIDEKGKESEQLTYKQLWNRTTIIASKLKSKGKIVVFFFLRISKKLLFFLFVLGLKDGSSVLLAHPPGLEFLCAFFGCLLAKIIAVPIYPLHPTQFKHQSKTLKNFLQDAGANVILTTEQYRTVTFMSSFFSGIPAKWYGTDKWKKEEKDFTFDLVC